MLGKTFKSTLSVILAIALCVPLAACQQGAQTQQSAQNASSQVTPQAYRWENFDDGSDYLSLDVPYIPANSNSFSFNIILEQGKYSASLSAHQLTLSGAAAGWVVNSIQRKDDVTAAVNISKPEGWVENGAATAQIELEASAVEVQTEAQPDETLNLTDAELDEKAQSGEQSGEQSSAQSNAQSSNQSNEQSAAQEPQPTADEINEALGVEWPTNDSSVVIENVDVDLTADVPDGEDAVGDAGAQGAEGTASTGDAQGAAGSTGGTASANAAEPTEDSSEPEITVEDDSPTFEPPYVVSAVFCNPYLDLEEDSITLDGTHATLKMKAVDFALDGRISKDSLSVEAVSESADAAANTYASANTTAANSAPESQSANITIETATLTTSTELEVVLNLPADNTDALDGAVLVLAASANETQSEVKGALKVPEPYLTVEQDYKDSEKAVFTATLGGTNAQLEPGSLSVSANDSPLISAQITQTAQNQCEITLPTSAATTDEVLQFEAANITDYAGAPAQNVQAAAVVEEVESRDILSDLALGVAKDALSTIAKQGYKGLYAAAINPQTETSIINAKADEILSKVAQVQTQLGNVDRRINALYDTVQAGQYEKIVNDSCTQISRVYNQEVLIAGKMKKFYNAEGGAAREAALKEFYENPANATLINELTVNMGVLYDTIVCASAASGKDLVQVFDDMCATTYNWGAQTYTSRQNFRENIATVWAEGMIQIDTVYNYVTENYENESQEANLNRFQEMTDEIDKLINETHKIDESCYKQTKGGKTALYNYTNAVWYTATQGTESGKGWDSAMLKLRTDSVLKKYYKKVTSISLATPFTSYFRKYTQGTGGFYVADVDFESSGETYATTAQVRAMTSRLKGGATLEGELKDMGFTTAKYLITSEKLDRFIHSKKISNTRSNDWLMDCFEVSKANSSGAGFSENKKFYDGWAKCLCWGKPQYHKNWSISPTEMFVLSYVKM